MRFGQRKWLARQAARPALAVVSLALTLSGAVAQTVDPCIIEPTPRCLYHLTPEREDVALIAISGDPYEFAGCFPQDNRVRNSYAEAGEDLDGSRNLHIVSYGAVVGGPEWRLTFNEDSGAMQPGDAAVQHSASIWPATNQLSLAKDYRQTEDGFTVITSIWESPYFPSTQRRTDEIVNCYDDSSPFAGSSSRRSTRYDDNNQVLETNVTSLSRSDCSQIAQQSRSEQPIEVEDTLVYQCRQSNEECPALIIE